MIYKKITFFILLFLFLASASSQIKVINIEKLPVGTSENWSNPKFSPDGKFIYFTTETFNGIWEYSFLTKSIREITRDAESGFGFDISENNKFIVYRRTFQKDNSLLRQQEIVRLNLNDKTFSLIEKGPDISTPVYSEEKIIYSVNNKTKNLQVSPNETIKILGIENTKIALTENGIKKTFDPFVNGSYIWASLSPDKKLIAAYDMSNGTFVSDLQGNIISKLGRRDAPIWTNDGKWIVYMKEKDDGHKILSSDIYCISPDGKNTVQLTDTPDITEMYPNCSPTENKIVCNSIEGDIYIINFEEAAK